MNPFTNEPYDWATDWQAIGLFIVLGAIGFATGIYVKSPYLYGVFLLAAPLAYRVIVYRRKNM